MLYAFKIIMCIVILVFGFIGYLKLDTLGELKTQATQEQKKDIDYIGGVAIIYPWVMIALVMCM